MRPVLLFTIKTHFSMWKILTPFLNKKIISSEKKGEYLHLTAQFHPMQNPFTEHLLCVILLHVTKTQSPPSRNLSARERQTPFLWSACSRGALGLEGKQQGTDRFAGGEEGKEWPVGSEDSGLRPAAHRDAWRTGCIKAGTQGQGGEGQASEVVRHRNTGQTRRA